MSSNCTSAAPVSASKTKTKKKHFIGQKVKLFRASEPILSVLMWGVNHTVSLCETRCRRRSAVCLCCCFDLASLLASCHHLSTQLWFFAACEWHSLGISTISFWQLASGCIFCEFVVFLRLVAAASIASRGLLSPKRAFCSHFFFLNKKANSVQIPSANRRCSSVHTTLTQINIKLPS